MPFITKQEVTDIRKALKTKFPKWKFSIGGSNSSNLSVRILKSTHDFKEKSKTVNIYWIDRSFEEQDAAVLQSILDTIYSVAERKTISEDADYGSIPSYYLDFKIGNWNKDCELVA